MHKRSVAIPPITPETTLENARRWLRIIRYHESGTVIQLQDDCEYRVPEVIENPALTRQFLGPYHRKYLLGYIPIDERDLLTAAHAELCRLLAHRSINVGADPVQLNIADVVERISDQGYDIGLFLSHLTPMLTGDHIQPLIDLESLIRSKKNLSVIVFSERDITHPQYAYLADKCSFLFDHALYYPLYDTPDARQFVTYSCREWDMTLSEDTINRLISQCGGYLWILHQTVRTLRDNPDSMLTDVFTHPLLQRKLETIWNKFSPEEQEIVRKTMAGALRQEDAESYAFRYLLAIRMIRMEQGKPVVGMPILQHIVERQKQLQSLQLQQNRLYIHGRNCTDQFSRLEKALLTVLLTHPKQVLSRDAIAESLWGEAAEERYSDWAIDRLASRLRKTVARLGADPTLIRSVKRKGLMFG